MLIRSQKKNVLVNIDCVDTIGICEEGERLFISSFSGPELTECELGEYSTAEKAIKVLDMIQRKYQDEQYMRVAYVGLNRAAAEAARSRYGNMLDDLEKAFVFQMPQDDEV
jgi:hypothetical protein